MKYLTLLLVLTCLLTFSPPIRAQEPSPDVAATLDRISSRLDAIEGRIARLEAARADRGAATYQTRYADPVPAPVTPPAAATYDTYEIPTFPSPPPGYYYRLVPEAAVKAQASRMLKKAAYQPPRQSPSRSYEAYTGPQLRDEVRSRLAAWGNR